MYVLHFKLVPNCLLILLDISGILMELTDLHFHNGIEDLFQPQYRIWNVQMQCRLPTCLHQLQSPECILYFLNTNLTVIRAQSPLFPKTQYSNVGPFPHSTESFNQRGIANDQDIQSALASTPGDLLFQLTASHCATASHSQDTEDARAQHACKAHKQASRKVWGVCSSWFFELLSTGWFWGYF